MTKHRSLPVLVMAIFLALMLVVILPGCTSKAPPELYQAGRTWTHLNSFKDGKQKRVQVTVVSVGPDSARLRTEFLNSDGSPGPNPLMEDKPFKSKADASGKKPLDQTEQHGVVVHAADRDWKCKLVTQRWPEGKNLIWISEEYPELVVKATLGDGMEILLVDFK